MCPIVGNPFLLQNAVIIKYNLNKCMISAHLYNAAQSRTQVNLQVSYAKQEDIRFVNQTTVEGNKTQQECRYILGHPLWDITTCQF